MNLKEFLMLPGLNILITKMYKNIKLKLKPPLPPVSIKYEPVEPHCSHRPRDKGNNAY
jgi:hypothetical protein